MQLAYDNALFAARGSDETALLRAALPGPDDAPARPSLAGQLLVAAPWMGDPPKQRRPFYEGTTSNRYLRGHVEVSRTRRA